jgi:hypothetical protein
MILTSAAMISLAAPQYLPRPRRTPLPRPRSGGQLGAPRTRV